MPLITCPVCEHRVSDQARACPSCGHPIAEGSAPLAPIAANRLDGEIARYVEAGYRITERTPTSAQLVRPKTFSFVWAFLWFLALGVGVLIYVFYYLSKRDEMVYLTVGEDGAVLTHVNGQLARPAGETEAAGGDPPLGLVVAGVAAAVLVMLYVALT